MKKITLLFFIATLSSLSALAQYNFAPITGPTNVVNGASPTLNLNDAGNGTAVTAGVYLDFSITVDWADDGTGTAWSSEADITVTTAAGSVLIDPATSGSAGDGIATTLTFTGSMAGTYDPSVDGTFDIIPNQSWAGSSADWSNIVVTINPAPACPDPTALVVDNFVGPNFADISWVAAAGATGYNWEVQPQGTPQGTIGEIDLGTTAAITDTATNLVDGTSYTLYVQSDCGGPLGNWVSTDFSFNLPPANDECVNAIALTVNTDYSCGTVTAGTTVGATASAQADDVTGTPNTDVWYSFVATGTDHRVTLTNVVNQGGGTSTSTDMGMGVYDATGGCGALAFFDDSDPDTLDLTGLTPATTYYVRVFGWYGTIQYNNFDICVGTAPAPPANDNLCNAISLTIDVTGIAGSYTNDSATEETSEPAGTCFNGGAQGTVWFSFVAPASGEVQVSTDIGGTLTDSEIAIYDATGVTCADLSTLPAELTCDQDSGVVVGAGYMNVLDLTVANTNAVTPGVTYYVQVSGYNNAKGTFGIQVFDQITLSVSDLALTEEFKAYPNPVIDELTVSAKSEIKQLSIVNMLGQTVRTVAPKNRSYKLDFSDLTSGIYFVKAKVNSTEGTFRIVKK